ncbi:MAG: asparaginase [Candidatus Aenigmarchaeota archaeon]
MSKKIALLTTGGTIAGANSSHSDESKFLDESTESIGRRPKTGEELFNDYPELKEYGDFEIKELCCIDSMYINSKLLKKFALEIHEYLSRPDIYGAMMLIGTHTAEYNALAQALMNQFPDKTIGITGSMNDKDRNHILRHLKDTANVVANSGINEFVLCFSGDEKSTFTNIYRGANVIKEKPWAYDAFNCPHEGPIGSVVDDEIIISKDYKSPFSSSRKPLLLDYATDKVMLKIHAPEAAGFADYDIDSLKDEGYEGIVINAGVKVADNDTLYPFVKENLKNNIAVAVTNTDTRYMTSDVRKRDDELKEMGLVDLAIMPQSKALVKMAWTIPQANGDMGKLQEMMRKNYVGELNYMNNFYKK